MSAIDGRTPLAAGAALKLGGRTYTIETCLGFGATSFVYAARYDDSLRDGKTHSVLVKELFPYHPKGLIGRTETGEITVPEEAGAYFRLRKKSFLRGNSAHIDLQNTRADMAGVNIDSFETHGSVYTVMGNLNGETLQGVLRGGGPRPSLPDVIHWMQRLLDALEVFHKNRLLHLDISPDNILLLPLDDDKPERQRRLLLIDYNSVWDMDELADSRDVYFSLKEHYTAPEARLRQQRAISPASDLFSVCAVFLELLQGKPLAYSELYTGGRVIDPEAGLLKNAPPKVRAKAAEILRQGLKLPPKRRFQTIGELRRALNELENLVVGEDVLKRAVGFFKRHVVWIAAVTLALAFALSFAAIRLNQSLSSYPVTTQEKYVTNNAMTALATSLGKLGHQIGNDLTALEALSGGYDSFAAAAVANQAKNGTFTLSQPYAEASLEAFRAGASPLRFDLLLELLNSPNDYRAWSDRMLAELESVFTDPAVPEADRALIAGLCTQRVNTYADACYTGMQLILLPLNDDGRRQILSALPSIPVFGEKFMSRPFGGSQADLESALTAAVYKLRDIDTNLISYGVDVR